MSFPRSLLLILVVLAASPLSAASVYPPSYRWKTLTTPHFYIHYHQGLEDLGSSTASLAEDIHDRLTPLLGWEPLDRTHVVLSDNIDASNGSATPFPNNRIELYVTAPGADPSSALEFYDDWLKLVLTHEYAHILHLDQAYAAAASFRRIFGRNPISFPNAYSPLWIIEGLATLVESEMTTGGRLKGTFVDMVLRTSAVENTWLDESKASGYTPEWPGGSARYFYGSKFLEYVAQKEGMDRLATFFHEYATSPVPFRVETTSLDIFGQSFGEMYDAWSESAQSKYVEQHRELVREGLTERELLTTLGFETKYAVISPNGKYLAYGHRGPYESSTLRILELVTGRQVASRKVNSISHLSWSPDSTRIAYSQLEFKNSFALLSDIYEWTVGESGARQITSGLRLKDPAFTGDGQSLVAVQNRAGRNRLVMVERGSRNLRILVEPEGYVQFSEPAVGPQGQIAVGEWRDGRIDVVLYDRDGTRLQNLTESLARSTNSSPRFSTDGSTIFFSGDSNGISNIYAVSLDGTNLRRITNLYGGGFFPSTTDGGSIYYVDYSSRGFDLARFTPDRLFETRSRTIPDTLIRRIEDPLDAIDRLAYPKPTRRTASIASLDAEPVSEPEPYRPWTSLAPTWWFPLLATSTYEIVLGAQTSGADVLGHHQYDAQFVARFGEEQDEYEYALIYAYDKLYPTLTAGLLQFDDNVGEVTFSGPDGRYVYRETHRRLVGLATFPYRRFWWSAFGTVGLVRDDFEQHLPFDIPADMLRDFGLFTGTLQGVRLGLAWDSTRQFGYSISSENGLLAAVDYERLTDGLGSDQERRQLTTDVRGFISIPVRRSPMGRHVLGFRAAAGYSEGDFILQREFTLGGTDLGGLLRLDTTRWPVRGFSTGRLRGQNVATGSVEYRFPIYQIDRGPAAYPLFFQRLIGDFFYDRGTAWNEEPVTLPGLQRRTSRAFEQSRTLASAGAEVGVDMVFGYGLPIRYRLGLAYLLESPNPGEEGDLELFLSAGSSF